MMTGKRMKWGGVGLTAALFGGVAVFSWLLVPQAGEAQEAGDLAPRVEAAPDGSVRFSFEAREGVCGDGRHISLNGDGRAAPLLNSLNNFFRRIGTGMVIHDYGRAARRQFFGNRTANPARSPCHKCNFSLKQWRSPFEACQLVSLSAGQLVSRSANC